MLQSAAVNPGSSRGTPGTHSYTYDALNRRVSKTTGGVTTVFVRSGQQIIAEYTGGAASANPARKYIYCATCYIDEPIALIDSIGPSEKTYYYHRNRQYSIIGLSDENGVVVERYAYTAYGDPTILAPDGTTTRPTSDYDNEYMHTGRRFEVEIGLYFYRARYYDAVLGRFAERDPLGYPDGLNTYAAYHVMRGGVDPSGLKKFVFNSYIKDWDWFNKDDIYAHHQFEIEVGCASSGKALNMGTKGPFRVVQKFDQGAVNGPLVQSLGNGNLQVDWSGTELEGDMAGWTIGAATGTALGFIIFGPTPEDLVFAGVGALIGGIFEGIFDDEVKWEYRRSVIFECECVDKGRDLWVVHAKEDPVPGPSHQTSRSDFSCPADWRSGGCGCKVLVCNGLRGHALNILPLALGGSAWMLERCAMLLNCLVSWKTRVWWAGASTC